MNWSARIVVACSCVLGAITCTGGTAGAQGIALRSGETAELGDVYYVSRDCKSLLTATPDVEIMEGPPGVIVTIREASIVPYAQSCATPVRGGKLSITAKNVDDYSNTTLVLRFKYKTRSGERHGSKNYRITLFP
jgi:hypothetical protein